MFGLLTVRKIRIGKMEYTITHRNPKTGELWIEDLYAQSDFRGKWINPNNYNINL